MRHIFNLVLAAALLAGTTEAQYRRPYEPGGARIEVVSGVLEHLERSRPHGYWSRGDANALAHARADLFRFRDRFEHGRFDRGRLDSAISHLDRLSRSHRLDARERWSFERDVTALRDFRAHESYRQWRR